MQRNWPVGLHWIDTQKIIIKKEKEKYVRVKYKTDEKANVLLAQISSWSNFQKAINNISSWVCFNCRCGSDFWWRKNLICHCTTYAIYITHIGGPRCSEDWHTDKAQWPTNHSPMWMPSYCAAVCSYLKLVVSPCSASFPTTAMMGPSYQ